MLAVPVTALPTEPGWAFEPKWDGYRGIGLVGNGKLRITSRRGNDMAPWFPELAGLVPATRQRLARLLQPLRTPSSPFDGPLGAGPWGSRTASTQRPIWVRAELWVVIAYRGLEGGQLRHPSYAGLHHPPA
jgi:ATP-dependent DNA ligase